MSSTSSQTTYTLNLGETSGGTLNFSSTDGFADSHVLAVAAALNGVTWPAGFALQLRVNKSETQSTGSTANLTATPPAFV